MVSVSIDSVSMGVVSGSGVSTGAVVSGIASVGAAVGVSVATVGGAGAGSFLLLHAVKPNINAQDMIDSCFLTAIPPFINV
jgi:hypothetical protein